MRISIRNQSSGFVLSRKGRKNGFDLKREKQSTNYSFLHASSSDLKKRRERIDDFLKHPTKYKSQIH